MDYTEENTDIIVNGCETFAFKYITLFINRLLLSSLPALSVQYAYFSE